LSLAESQLAAIWLALLSKVLVMTGGPRLAFVKEAFRASRAASSLSAQKCRVISLGREYDGHLHTARSTGFFAAAGAATALDRRAIAADFDWKRFSGAELHFMVSVHPWTGWGAKAASGLGRRDRHQGQLGDHL